MARENPYTNAVVIKYDDGDISLERNESLVETTASSRTYTVKEGDTIQNIAFRFYKDSGNWYKIADYNGIYNPFTDMPPGTFLIIP